MSKKNNLLKVVIAGVLASTPSFAMNTNQKNIKNYQNGYLYKETSDKVMATVSSVREDTSIYTRIDIDDPFGNTLEVSIKSTTEFNTEPDNLLTAVIMNLDKSDAVRADYDYIGELDYTLDIGEAKKTIGVNSFVVSEMTRCEIDLLPISIKIRKSEVFATFFVSGDWLTFNSNNFSEVTFCE